MRSRSLGTSSRPWEPQSALSTEPSEVAGSVGDAFGIVVSRRERPGRSMSCGSTRRGRSPLVDGFHRTGFGDGTDRTTLPGDRASKATRGEDVTSYIMRGNLSERQIESDVAAYLGWCSRRMPFRLLDVDEQATGADRLCDVTVPIYLQFKKSNGLKPLPEPQPNRRANESPLQAVRRFRRERGLADDPTLYFQLRRRAEGAADLQHNVLLAHNRPTTSYAVYVAPLHLGAPFYSRALYRRPRYRIHPFEWNYANIWGDGPTGPWLSRFDRQPFLRCHVSIAPHERVAHHNHYYAFSRFGDQVSWHSPTVMDGGSSLLSDFLTARTRELITGDSPLPSPEAALAAAESAVGELGISTPDVLAGDDPFERLRSYGRWLRSTFRIRQWLVCAQRKHLEEARRSPPSE